MPLRKKHKKLISLTIDTPKYQQRLKLLELVPQGASCAEVGVRMGAFSEMVLSTVRPKEFWLVDPCEDYPGNSYREPSQKTLNVRFKRLQASFGANPVVKLLRARSAIAAPTFASNSLDFVYVDGNHYYEHVLLDLLLWARVVKVGGYIAGDDYCDTEYMRERRWEPKKAIDAFMALSGFPMVFLNEFNGTEIVDSSWAIKKTRAIILEV